MNYLHRCTLRFHRTADEAFRTPRYATAMECVYLPPWKRIVIALWRYL